MPYHPGSACLPCRGHPEVRVSVPERALLELLSDAGKYQNAGGDEQPRCERQKLAGADDGCAFGSC